MLGLMPSISEPALKAIFQSDDSQPPRALLVAGACGNVGFGKLGQFARLLTKYCIPVIALDLSDQIHNVKDKLKKAFGSRFSAEEISSVLDNIQIIQGTLDDVPADVEIGFVFEAIPELLDIKRPFYNAIRNRDRDSNQGAFIFSATSGITSQTLFDGIPGSDRCGVMHPFFPHLTNKIWEIPTRGCTTSEASLKTIRKWLGHHGMNIIETADVPAFAADRIFCGMMLEAVRIHASTGLSPAQIDDACRIIFGTSPFAVHNMIPGANYLSAHCMELCQKEVSSTLFEIPDIWKPYTKDPRQQWPYERGEKCPADKFELVRDRMYGMMFALTAYILEHNITPIDNLNYLCENALAFRAGLPALIEDIGHDVAQSNVKHFLESQSISAPSQVAPIDALSSTRPGWGQVYVETAVHGEVGLLSIKRNTISHVFIAELDAAYETLQANSKVKAIVIAPDGQLSREFGHGADLNCFAPVLGNYDAAFSLIVKWKQTLSKLAKGKPTVAALVGRVLGGSLELASCCTARIAAQGTHLGQPEPTVGVIPGLGGCHHIHRFSSPEYYTRINELLLTGQGFKSEEAEKWGFVNANVPVHELPSASMELASKLANGSFPTPLFRRNGVEVNVNRDVNPRNEAGVALDAELRELLAQTIEDANRLPYTDATKLEEQRAAKSLTMSSSAIGVKAMMRGKAPEFAKPLP